MCSRSFTAADDTRAAPQSTPGAARGAPSLQAMMQINCGDIAEDAEVRDELSALLETNQWCSVIDYLIL